MSTVIFIKTNCSQVYSVNYKIQIECTYINDREGKIYSVIPKEQRLCIFCHLDVEDEYHFIFKCSMYHEYRKLYIKKYYWYKPSMYKLLQLLSTENTTELSNLGKYLQKAETLRNLSVIDK